jgi:hypothetical protein
MAAFDVLRRRQDEPQAFLFAFDKGRSDAPNDPASDITSSMHQLTMSDHLVKSLAGIGVGHLAAIEVEYEKPNCR